MATTRKSAKRAKNSERRGASARRKTGRKRTTSRRPVTRVKTTGRSRRKSANSLSKRAAQGVRAARSGVKTVKQAGDKIWKRLRATTTQVVEGVRDRLADDAERTTPSR
jgi:hypothetical protein